MSKIIRTEKPSVLPWYGLAAVWLVFGLLFPLYKLSVLLITAAASAVVFFFLKKTCPPRVMEHTVDFNTGVGDVDEMLAGMQKQLDHLHRLNAELPDPTLSAAMDRMEKAGRSIVEVVEKSPDKAKAARRFANYYLPDAVNVLDQYATLARQGVRGANAAEMKAKVDQNAASIATAFENQLDSLYASENMNLDADVEVLQNMMKGQGLE
jgi:5-bromo-4-chloroindolyl phosphate hydrolysis protein